jgi:hypothetical protein
MNQNNTSEILWRAIENIVKLEHRPFSYADIVEKGVQITNTNFRNYISKWLKAGRIVPVYYSPEGFYTIKGEDSTSYVTDDHTTVNMGTPVTTVTPPHLHTRHTYRQICNDPVYRIIQNLPFGKRSVHDIRLKFVVAGIWSSLSSIYPPNNKSKDLRLDPWPLDINDLNLKVTIHATDTISIDIGCSYYPVAVDVDGVVRLSTALAITRERLSHIIESCTNHQNSNPSIIPDHMTWIVTMWHFGRDALIEYKGEKFHTSWEVGQHALIVAYSKEWADSKKRVRIEKQEYPRKSLAEALEEKLNGISLPSSPVDR